MLGNQLLSVFGKVGSGGDAEWWEVAGKTTVAAYQAKGAASLAASYVNLANPGTHNLAVGNAPTWDTGTGWTFDGGLDYLTSTLIPSSGWSAFVRFSGNTTGDDRTPFGSFAGGSLRFIINACASGVGNDRVLYQNGGLIAVAGGINSGVLGFGGQTAYRNGVAESGTIPVWSGTSTRPIYVGATNNAGTVTSYWNGVIQALAIFSDVLTAGEVAALTTRMQAL